MTFRVEPLEVDECGGRCPARDRRRRRDRGLDAAGPSSISSSPAPTTRAASASSFSTREAATSSPRWCSATFCAGCASPASSDGFRCGRRSGPYRRRMPVGLRLRHDGRGPPGGAARQRSRAASHVDRRDRGRGFFGQRTTRSFADAPMVAVLARYARADGRRTRTGAHGGIAAARHHARAHAARKCGVGR